MIHPTGHRVLVRPDKIEEGKDLGDGRKLLIARVDNGEAREQFAVIKGTVVAVGPTAWKAFREVDHNGKWVNGRPWASVGDRVIYAKFSGFWAPDDNEEVPELMLLNDEDILAVIASNELKEVQFID